MGCATSKPKVCQNCHTPYSPVRRSYSMYIPKKKDINESEQQHMVSLTSSTLGSLKLDSMNLSQSLRDDHFAFEIDDYHATKDELLIEAKTWSQMINEKIPKVVIPKTPVKTPPGEPETINAWELMEGLEDITPLKPKENGKDISFSFTVSPNTISFLDDQPKENGDDLPKMADNESSLHSTSTSIISDFDPEVISTFRKALEDLPPANPFHLKPLIIETMHGPNDEVNGEVLEARRCEVLREYKLVLPHEKDKLVIYFTSLRGVRKTYEDCCHVRVILKGLGVKVDERDVSMHSGFKEELKELMGKEYAGGGLPRVFLGKKYIGGADEIRRINEDGNLEKLVENCERIEDGGGGGSVVGNLACEACGDIRFVPCETCSGSCKIYYEADYDELEIEEEDEYGFQRCPDCNENGLIRCPICCD
ncbi:uncharacterized protein At3g28850-like [Lycium ferocissimum]|uniref:uncharacterized protein At3g28850-like n=1 Tax=Lycium ferocissimum TaxID=112874 RepID=UPI002816665B|nr:uncharacterized protein At3g28850-like [Lycium ferocissimum]